MSGFPDRRMRRMRATPLRRDLVAETHPRPEKLIQPHFIVEGQSRRETIASLPEVERQSIDVLVGQIDSDLAAGVRSHILFGLPDTKDAEGSAACDDDGLVSRALRELRARFGGDVLLVTDVCLCAYTDHGHCGILTEDGAIDNDATLVKLARTAVAHAAAGADIVAPSDMMDGRVGVIRRALDERGFQNTAIMSYAVKYASAFYGPFRDAAGSAPASGDRRSHQMDVRNASEAIEEALLDVDEGADLLMVKPALPCLDIIQRLTMEIRLPLAAYQVSGEYAQIHLAARAGAGDLREMAIEALTAINRAGAGVILTYFARRALREKWL